MILAIDIGNTNIVAGGIDNKKVRFVERLSTINYKSSEAGSRKDYELSDHGHWEGDRSVY